MQINSILCFLYLFDIFLGGGGTILSFRGISYRMLIFALTFINLPLIILKNPKIRHIKLIIAFCILNLLAVILGVYNKAILNYILLDIKPLLSFFMIYPLFLFMKNIEIKKISKMIKISGLIMGITYIIIYLIMRYDIVPFAIYYNFFSNLGNGEIFFRGNNKFFYKGFLYLNLAFIFYCFEYKKNYTNKILCTLLFVSIYLTDTRGFILALILCYISYLFIEKKIKKIIGLIIIGSPVIYQIMTRLFIKVSEERKGGDSLRIFQIKEVFKQITPISFLIGHGYGKGIEGREIHMEIVYLEIFHKQGILGILFYSILLFQIFYFYKKIKNSEIKKEYIPYLIGTLFVYFQSMTNPFLINPIGLTFVLLSIIVGSILISKKENQ